MGIRNPKGHATSWAQGETVTTAQLAAILENGRRTAMFPFLNLRPTLSAALNASGARLQDVILYSDEKQVVFFAAGDFDENDITTSTNLDDGSWVSVSSSLIASGDIHPTRGAAARDKADVLLWFGVHRGNATSEGYILNNAGSWSIANRAAAGTSLDEVIGMWYWPEMDTFIASWRYTTNAHRFETNTADAGWVDTATGLTGDFEVHKADMSATDFIGVGLSSAGTATTDITHSSDGVTFTAVTLSQSKQYRLVAYDRTEGIWYLLASDWSLFTCSGDPSVGSNWSEETNFVAPTNATLRTFGSFQPDLIVQGGIIAIGGAQLESSDSDTTVLVTSDFGTTWVRAAPLSSPAVQLPILKILDGRLVWAAGYGSNDDLLYVGPRGLDPMTLAP